MANPCRSPYSMRYSIWGGRPLEIRDCFENRESKLEFRDFDCLWRPSPMIRRKFSRKTTTSHLTILPTWSKCTSESCQNRLWRKNYRQLLFQYFPVSSKTRSTSIQKLWWSKGLIRSDSQSIKNLAISPLAHHRFSFEVQLSIKHSWLSFHLARKHLLI